MEPERESGQILCKGGIMIKKADNVDAYVQALRQLTARPQELVRMGQANASRAAQFGSERVQETMKMIYERLAGDNGFLKIKLCYDDCGISKYIESSKKTSYDAACINKIFKPFGE